MVGKTILIVDDEAPIREMIAVALEMAGYECLEAENTQQAHAVIVDRKPDLILLDWMLPGTSGIELARRLKRDELTVDIPIIMLTAKGEEDNKIQGCRPPKCRCCSLRKSLLACSAISSGRSQAAACIASHPSSKARWASACFPSG